MIRVGRVCSYFLLESLVADGKKALQVFFEHLGYVAAVVKQHRTRRPLVPEPLLAAPERLRLVARKLDALGFSGAWAPQADPDDKLGSKDAGPATSSGGGKGKAEDDDEVEVVGGKGNGHDYTLPHLRPNCLAKPWQPNGDASNEICCSECYCYVCDVPAKECQSWRGEHCHATDQNPTHVALRQAKNDLTW